MMVLRLATVLILGVCMPATVQSQPLDDIITANMTYGQYCSSLREVLLREQTGIVCELSDDCTTNLCTDALNPNVVISGYKLDPCAKQYTIIFAGETLVLRTDRDTVAGFGTRLFSYGIQRSTPCVNLHTQVEHCAFRIGMQPHLQSMTNSSKLPSALARRLVGKLSTAMTFPCLLPTAHAD